jgi:hypothetical protein
VLAYSLDKNIKFRSKFKLNELCHASLKPFYKVMNTSSHEMIFKISFFL